jgi:hypothetical protein
MVHVWGSRVFMPADLIIVRVARPRIAVLCDGIENRGGDNDEDDKVDRHRQENHSHRPVLKALSRDNLVRG